MHHAEILIGHFREMVGNWPVASKFSSISKKTVARSSSQLAKTVSQSTSVSFLYSAPVGFLVLEQTLYTGGRMWAHAQSVIILVLTFTGH